MSKVEKELASLFIDRELNDKEKEKRATAVEKYLFEKGGTIAAISCQDGILLAGINPDYKRNIFQIYHRISLLAIGKARDYEKVHKNILILVLRATLRPSKADIDVKEIIKELAEELEEDFSFKGRKHSCRANFIMVELGFNFEDDIIEMVIFNGDRSEVRRWGIIEIPNVKLVPTVITEPNKKKDKKKEDRQATVSSETKSSKKAKKKKERIIFQSSFEYPIGKALEILTENMGVYKDYIWTVQEAAFFVGLLFFLLDKRGGRLEMVYLDREMLKKAKSEERRFHHIWQSITTPDSYALSDPYENWKRFIAPVYDRIKEGKISPDQKILIDYLERIEKQKKPKKEKNK